jgi:hypothetical protein
LQRQRKATAGVNKRQSSANELGLDKLLCVAVLIHLGADQGASFENLRFPDLEDSSRPRVDMILNGKDVALAFEHTRIESYTGQLDDIIRFKTLLSPLEEDLCREELPAGIFSLGIQVGALEGAKDGESIRPLLSAWVLKKAPSLTMGKPPGHMITEKLEGVPFEVTLSRFSGTSRYPFQIKWKCPENLEELRRYRIRKALDDKLTKLSDMKAEGRKTVLVLESADVALGSAPDIGLAVVSEVRDDDVLPDLCFLLDTGCVDSWLIYEIHINRTGSFPLGGSTEIDPRQTIARARQLLE